MSYIVHSGIKGQKWGVRRYQNEDGTLTPEGEKRYNEEGSNRNQKRAENKVRDIERAKSEAKKSMDKKVSDLKVATVKKGYDTCDKMLDTSVKVSKTAYKTMGSMRNFSDKSLQSKNPFVKLAGVTAKGLAAGARGIGKGTEKINKKFG